MQTVSRYLLDNTVIVYQNGYHGRNSTVYDRRLKIYKGVRNSITFTFKNEDQKAQFINDKRFEFNIIDNDSKSSVYTTLLTILDDGSTTSTKGAATVDIDSGDLLELDAKFYTYSIREMIVDWEDSTLQYYAVTYADSFYNAPGTLEVIDGAFADFKPSTEINSFTSTTGPLEYTSSAIDATPGLSNHKALHTVAIYQKSFEGTLRIQGTMSSSPNDNDYFEVASLTFDNTTDPVIYYNFTGVYENIRFSWDNDSGNNGKIDKILYRH